MLEPAVQISSPVICVGDHPLNIEELIGVAIGQRPVTLSRSPAVRDRISQSQKCLQQAFDRREAIYGLNTGFGSTCGNRMGPEEAQALGDDLVRYHGCGTGPVLEESHVRGALICRLLCMSLGYSGVSIPLIQRLVDFLNRKITPVVPSQGSVGASGDLTPMSYIAAALTGEREVFYKGKRMPSSQALQAAELDPIRLEGREAIALLNGTAVMTGIAISVVNAARNLLHASTIGTALAVHALGGHPQHYDSLLFKAKPFPSQASVAAHLRSLLGANAHVYECDAPEAFQDPYSLRCAPQVLGVLGDALTWVSRWVEIEANGASDNPLIDPTTGTIHMGGNFYGGHIGFAMDALKSAISSAADMADRQVALLVDPKFSRGLTTGLVHPSRSVKGPQHGFKGLQITMSALTAEALHASMPASVFSRSTESHNQDKVSMGTIAARDAMRVCELVQRIIAIQLIVAAQGCEIRGFMEARPVLHPLFKAIRHLTPSLTEDRPLDKDIDTVAMGITSGALTTPISHE